MLNSNGSAVQIRRLRGNVDTYLFWITFRKRIGEISRPRCFARKGVTRC